MVEFGRFCFGVMLLLHNALWICACIVKMEGELGSSSQGRKSSLLVSGMGVPGGQASYARRLYRGPMDGYICLGGIHD